MRTTSSEGPWERCPDAVAVLDPDGGAIRAVNGRCTRLCDRSRDALEGVSLGALAPDGWEPPTTPDALLERARDGRVAFDWRVERPDGTAVPLRCAMELTEGPDGPGAVVTMREADRDTPPERDGGLRALIDNMDAQVFVVDRSGTFAHVNRVAIERLGYTRAELRSMGPGDLWPAEHAAAIANRVGDRPADGTGVIESVAETAAGERIPVEIRASAVRFRGEPVVMAVARDVSERRARMRDLRTFKQAVEQAGHAVYITDTDGTIEYVNPAFERVTGYGEDEALGRTPRILKSGEMDECYYEELWETLLDGGTWEEEICNERADGERYYAEQTIAPITVDGEVAKFVAVQHNVTERKEREQKLERYQQLIENVPVGVFRSTPGLSGRFEQVNPAMVEMFGAESAADLLDTYVAELYRAPGRRELVSRKLEREGMIVEEEIRMETLDGEPFWAAVTAIRHEEDGDVYYDGIVQDVSERRETARQLRLREQRFRRLFEDHNAPMLLVDPDTGSIERANEAAVEFYGYEKTTLESMAIQEINRLDDEEIARRRQAAKEGETNRFIFPHELADGTVRTVEVDSSPIRTGEGRLLFSILHDVTERERTRETLERQNEQLELLNRVVRHDIRNDMSVVLGRAQMLGDHVDGAGEAHLDALVDHGEHVVELTRTARELMETMLEEDASGPGSAALADVLAAEIEEVDGGYEDAVFTVEGDLPDVRVRGNEMLASVFRNVLRNAVQHNDTDEPRVEVSVDVGDERVTVHVADNGPGVPDAQKEDIFGEGELGMDSSGTGLGLYLVTTFVDQFGGDVWVTDNDPEGAVFHVELRRAD